MLQSKLGFEKGGNAVCDQNIRAAAVILFVAATPAAAADEGPSPFQVWVSCVQQSFAVQHQTIADPAESAERAFTSCQTEAQVMKTDALSRTPNATADDADQVETELKLTLKQRLVQSATVQPPPQTVQTDPQADKKRCAAAAELIGSSWANNYQRQFALDVLRSKCIR